MAGPVYLARGTQGRSLKEQELSIPGVDRERPIGEICGACGIIRVQHLGDVLFEHTDLMSARRIQTRARLGLEG